MRIKKAILLSLREVLTGGVRGEGMERTVDEGEGRAVVRTVYRIGWRAERLGELS